MKDSTLIPISYYDPAAKVHLRSFADTVVVDASGDGGQVLCAIRFGGYPEVVRGTADAIYGGGSLDFSIGRKTVTAKSLAKQYRRQITHDGLYAEATLIADPDMEGVKDVEDADAQGDTSTGQRTMPELPPRKAYLFCRPGDRDALFAEVDRVTAVPLIPAFQDFILSELEDRGILRQLTVYSATKPFDAWVLILTSEDANVVAVVEAGLKSGALAVPGGRRGPSPFGEIDSVTGYLGTFGPMLAERIKKMFVPLFDPATEPLSSEVLEINNFIRATAGYGLYDAQLAVTEAMKRQLSRSKVGIVVAECGSGKTKIGATALAALWGLRANQARRGQDKTFNIVLCPSHMTKKWVREIEETLPNTFGVSVRSIGELDRIHAIYEQGEKSCYVVMSKEKARDGYMRAPTVKWSRRHRGFLCPDCGAVTQMDISKDGVKYKVKADQAYFKREHDGNHKCEACDASLWTALNPEIHARKSEWAKIGNYGFVHRRMAYQHYSLTKNAAVIARLDEIERNPNGAYPAVGAYRAYPLSTYIKKKYKGRVDGLIVDELHEYAQNSGQGDAMGELFGAAKKVVGLTGTLINGYASGLFHLLYRIAAPLMRQDGKAHSAPAKFNAEYGVTENVYETKAGDYNSNRRTIKSKKSSRQLPGVSPLVYSRFLLEIAAFLTLSDMGKNLPDYEEIPIALEASDEVMREYSALEKNLRTFMKEDKKAAKKVLSAYLNLLTAYPDQPYNQPPVLHPVTGEAIVAPKDVADFDTIMPKDEVVLDLVAEKIAAGGKVAIYTNWTRLDTQRKLHKLLTAAGHRTEILPPSVKPEKREDWVAAKLERGLQVLITNPTLVQTGLDLNAFTTLMFYDVGYKLFTLRQASRRSWRINQAAPRIEVYMLYYKHTMQHKALRLMANKLAVAGIIEGGFSEEGLAAMSECEDMTTVMAKELMLGIKDNVEDVAAAFKKMAVINPDREAAPVPTAPETTPSVLRLMPARAPIEKPTPSDVLGDTPEALIAAVALVRKKKKSVIGVKGQVSFFDLTA